MNTDAFDKAIPLYSAEQMRDIDRKAMGQAGISGYTLMTRAATAAWDAVRARFPDSNVLLVLCGSGNNGGDGFVLARLAHAAGCNVQVVLAGDPGKIAGDAAHARDDWLAAGGNIDAVSAVKLPGVDLVIDAMLGTGFSGELRGDVQRLAALANAAETPVIALDIPTGLSADTGHAAADAIHATLTVTFIACKPGLFTGDGPDCCGELVYDRLEVPGSAAETIPPVAMLDPCTDVHPFGMPRRRNSHKRHYGHVLVAGGDHGMPGAVRLAGEAALRCGAGLVTVATHPEHAVAIAANCPELVCRGVNDGRDLGALLVDAGVVVIGPGLGRAGWGRSLCAAVFESGLPLVVDADALNLLAQEPGQRENWVLTPHPGEAARLLGTDTATIQADRIMAVRAIASRYGGVAVLKGAGTVTCADRQVPAICAAGNPGMASAGMGDVLAGMVAALAGQGLCLPDAARAAVAVHAVAGDLAAESGERGLLARDVIETIPALLNDEP